jgi:outer membrane receptor protein involved in Fe transport
MSNANINVPVKSFNFNFGFNYRGEYSQPDADFRKPVSSRLVTNTRVSYKATASSWSFFVDVKNLFNTQYNYPASSFAFYNHFPARGVQASIGIAFKTTGL